jgi:transposase
VSCAGVEGTSSYGAGLARHLRACGIEVLEVERPERRRRSSRRNLQKSDPSDAEAAARAGNRPQKPRACPRAATVLWR